MGAIETLTKRNKDFAALRFKRDLSLMPTLSTMIIGCVDPRVDPAHVLGLDTGEATVIRNVGGRITPATLQTMAMLGIIGTAEGADPGSGWNVIVLQHTDCGITRLTGRPELLADHFGIAKDQLAGKAVADPWEAVVADITALKHAAFLPSGLIVSGLVYDVATGLIDPVVAPAPLRGQGQPA